MPNPDWTLTPKEIEIKNNRANANNFRATQWGTVPLTGVNEPWVTLPTQTGNQVLPGTSFTQLTDAQRAGQLYNANQNIANGGWVNWPVPGSASSVLGNWTNEADTFANTLYTNDLADYNAPIDKNAIYADKLKQSQAQIDSTSQLYADKLNQARMNGQGRLGSSTAMQARWGLLWSDFGQAQTNTVQNANQDVYNAIDNEKNAALQAIYAGVKNDAASELALKTAAKEKGGQAVLQYLRDKADRSKKLVTDSAKKLLALGVDPASVSDSELKNLGLDRNDLVMSYNEQKFALADQATKDAAAAQKTSLENAKTEAEINQIYWAISKAQAEGSKYYEVGNKIYEMGTNKFISDAVFNPNNPFQVTPGNAVYNPTTWAWSQAPTGNSPTGFTPGNSGMRTDRHNNPVAMTTDVAKTLWLVEWVDFVKWDPFPNNPNLFTARFTGDGLQTTIKALDSAAIDPSKSAFITQSGQPRWTYINMSDQDWLSKTQEQKVQIISQMYQKEWGNWQFTGGGGQNEIKQQALTSAQALLDKFDQGIGTSAVWKSRMLTLGLWSFPGTAPRDFEIQFNNLKSLLSLDNIKLLKGQGAVSDAERKLLAEASSKLDLAQSEEEFRAALLSIRDALSGNTQSSTDTQNMSSTTTNATAPSGITWTIIN